MTDEQSTSRNAAQPRYGRRPPKAAPALRLASLLSGTLPPTPTAVDYGKRFTGWQMLGNDSAGDCVAVSWANQRALVTTVLAEHTSYPTQDQVWQLYKTQNPQFDPAGSPSSTGPGSPADQGMEIQSALEYLVKTGGPDGVKAAAFAKVDHTDEAELRAAHAIFGQVWYGVNVQKANQSEFSGGKPWDYVAASPIEGGHSITGVGYDPKDYRFVTWARETMWTEAFRKHLVEEAWVVVWPEHFGAKEFQAGIDLGELAGLHEVRLAGARRRHHRRCLCRRRQPRHGRQRGVRRRREVQQGAWRGRPQRRPPAGAAGAAAADVRPAGAGHVASPRWLSRGTMAR